MPCLALFCSIFLADTMYTILCDFAYSLYTIFCNFVYSVYTILQFFVYTTERGMATPLGLPSHGTGDNMRRRTVCRAKPAARESGWQGRSEQQGRGAAVHESERQDPRRVAGPATQRCV